MGNNDSEITENEKIESMILAKNYLIDALKGNDNELRNNIELLIDKFDMVLEQFK